MYAGLLLSFFCQFGRLFNETEALPIEKKIVAAKTIQPISLEFLAQASNGTDNKIHIKAYSGKSCKWCKQSYDLVGEGDERLVIDWTEDPLPDTVAKQLRPGYQFPVFVCEQEDGTLSYPRIWNLYNRDQLVSMFNSTKPLKVKTYEAHDLGGVMRGRDHIDQLFDWLDQNAGNDIKITLSWDRTGAQTFPFKSGTDWSTNALLGRMGYFGFKSEGVKSLPISELSTGYRYIDNTNDLELTPKIVIKNLGTNQFNSTQDVPKLDPLIITTVITAGQILYQILNPKIDLQLPGNIETEILYKDRKLQATFNRGPNVRITAWFEFNLAVKNAILDREKLRLEFSGSRWIKSREIKIVD